MKISKITSLFLVYLVFTIIAGCSRSYHVDFVFTGTIQEILNEQEMLVMKEHVGEDEGRKANTYEIPVDNIEQYAVGQKLNISVLSNTDEDVWDLNRMKF
ncbi:hypothetical protein [Chengkuizengella axinellae]|uniref:DUF3221 domain-containing protein n=1 Tax=Chengkuizengella axinellae TaxID=3064388 RepID=A0ABT9J3C5_9BACL|nr:hypothetical protein [Chengkuizengella sp. 2205SS18-9]MDP5276098.1 hypothetical protein [Chengkuizengella sp. 2205SS18-9]